MMKVPNQQAADAKEMVKQILAVAALLATVEAPNTKNSDRDANYKKSKNTSKSTNERRIEI